MIIKDISLYANWFTPGQCWCRSWRKAETNLLSEAYPGSRVERQEYERVGAKVPLITLVDEAVGVEFLR